ncbi:MAG: response regulator [Bdellovibrionales bacterium]|nr:response regulator [Bdellovibrionales bacterium]
MALSRTIAHEFGGDLSFDTSADGTVFKFRIPCVAQSFAAKQKPSGVYKKYAFNKRVLIVDDEVGILNVLKGLLEDYDCKVTVTPDAHTALSLVENDQYDYVITDMKMPTMDGLELIQRINSLNSTHTPKIVAMSGGVSNYYEQLVKQSKIVAFVSKPFSEQKFVEIFSESA